MIMRRLSWHVGSTVFTAILVALLVMVSLDAVGALIDEAGSIRRNYQFVDVLVYVGTTLPSTAYEYIPFASLIGCLVGLGMLAGNSEVVVMRASGVSLFRIVTFVLKPVLVFILVGIAIGEYVSPYLDQLAEGRREYLRKGESAQDSTSGLWIREDNEYIHFNAVFPGGVVFGMTRYRLDEEKELQEASFSTRATYHVEGGHWIEENVAITRFYEERTETDKQVTRRWETGLTPEVLALDILPAEALSVDSLHRYVQFLEQQKRDTSTYQLALWSKLLQPLTIIALVLVGISFVFGPLRESTMGFRIFIGVVTGVLFRIGQDMLGPSSLVFGFPPVIAVLLPIVVCMLVGLLLLRRAG